MKIVFDFANSRVLIEGDKNDVMDVLQAAHAIAPNVQQIQIVQVGQGESKQTRQISDQRESPLDNSQNPAHGKTLRQFARSLTLDNSAERIAAIAYYVNKIESRPSFSPKDMDGWFTMCGFQKPSQMPVALFDAKRKYGYADNVGRGMWRISNQGENLIIGKIEENNGQKE